MEDTQKRLIPSIISFPESSPVLRVACYTGCIHLEAGSVEVLVEMFKGRAHPLNSAHNVRVWINTTSPYNST